MTYRDYIKEFKQDGVRYGWSYTDFSKLIDYYNISRLPDYDNATEPYLAYLLFSKPMLNLARSSDRAFDENARNNLSSMQSNPMSAAFSNDPYGLELLMSMSECTGNNWLPLLTTRAMSYSVTDVELKTVEKGNTYYGHVLKYGKHSEEHKISNTVSIDFRNDRYLSVLKMIYLWMCYIYNVSKNDTIQPKLLFQRNGILDYAGSIYYLVTRRDGREIVYWEKLVGVFPLNAPFSIFNFSDNFIIEDKLSINFQYGIRADPCDPNILLDINVLSGRTAQSARNSMWTSRNVMSGEVLQNNAEAPFVLGDVYAAYPFITMQQGDDGTIKYFLRWIR